MVSAYSCYLCTLMNTVYLLLGSNEGDRVHWLIRSEVQIGISCGIIKAASSLYETAAWGVEDQPDFLNKAICIETVLDPFALLKILNDIEAAFGRQRHTRWGQRTLDIDILLYNSEVVDTPTLKIPHPAITQRRFTLEPLAEIAPNLVHPLHHKTITELLAICPDPLPVKKMKIVH